MKIGIVGLPNVGKSTLFKALTSKTVEIANYPFATIEPNIGVVPVPDPRLDALSQMSRSAKTIPTVVEFVDIAGLVKGAAEGEGLGNQFLAHIREADAIAEVVRAFADSDIIHVSGAPDPVADIEVLKLELILKDLETVERRVAATKTEIKAGKQGAEEELRFFEWLADQMRKGSDARAAIASTTQWDSPWIRHALDPLCLLTAKPLLYVFNVAEGELNEWTPSSSLARKIEDAPWVAISAKIEAELTDVPDTDAAEYLAVLGIQRRGLDELIRIGYETLGLITFFTTGEDETRAWTIRRGATAPEAGRAIHSDFEDKFIRAEVIAHEKLAEAGSWPVARDKGWIRTEGKDYIVQDGDVMIFKI